MDPLKKYFGGAIIVMLVALVIVFTIVLTFIK